MELILLILLISNNKEEEKKVFIKNNPAIAIFPIEPGINKIVALAYDQRENKSEPATVVKFSNYRSINDGVI